MFLFWDGSIALWNRRVFKIPPTNSTPFLVYNALTNYNGKMSCHSYYLVRYHMNKNSIYWQKCEREERWRKIITKRRKLRGRFSFPIVLYGCTRLRGDESPLNVASVWCLQVTWYTAAVLTRADRKNAQALKGSLYIQFMWNRVFLLAMTVSQSFYFIPYKYRLGNGQFAAESTEFPQCPWHSERRWRR